MARLSIILCAILGVACNGGSGSAAGETDTDGSSGTAGTAGPGTGTDSGTSAGTASTGSPAPDYWDDGLCNGAQTPSADDCKDVDFGGECTAEGQVIWCENGQLFCIHCEMNGLECAYVDRSTWYDCVEPPDPTTGGSTSTGTGTSG